MLTKKTFRVFTQVILIMSFIILSSTWIKNKAVLYFIAILFSFLFVLFFEIIESKRGNHDNHKEENEDVTSDTSTTESLLDENRSDILLKKISKISEMLGQSSGYLDILTYQSDLKVDQISDSFQFVVEGTQHENDSISQVVNHLEQVVVSINEIAEGAQNQAKSVEEATNISSYVTSSAESVYDKAQKAVNASNKAAEVAMEGEKIIIETVKAIKRIEKIVSKSAEKVKEMEKRSTEIGTIVETIKDIADQTNLLALNAAIEAARAGEMGRGFSVVASEVRKLAEHSLRSTKEVSDIVSAIQKSARNAEMSMNEGVKEVEAGVSLANQSGEVIESILATSDLVKTELIEIVNHTKNQVELTDQLNSAMESVSAVVEENAALTEEMTAESDTIDNEIKNISEISSQNSKAAKDVSSLTTGIKDLSMYSKASAQTLAEMASSMQNAISSFRTKDQSKYQYFQNDQKRITPTIGVILPATNNLFWKTLIEFANIGANDLGIDLIICDSKGEKPQMESHLQQLITNEVDGILWIPYFGLGRNGLCAARDAGIPVILVDSYESGLQPQSEEFPNYLAFVGPADESGAYEMGKYLIGRIPTSKDGKKYIISLDGPEGAQSGVNRHMGLMRAIKEHNDVVLATSRRANFDYDTAIYEMVEILKENSNIQGVWAANDLMAQGAIEAAKRAGFHPGKDIQFVGMDLDEKSIKKIQQGEQLFSIGGHCLQLGFGLSIMYDALNGFPLPKGNSIIKLPMLPLTYDRIKQYEKEFPNGIPVYDFKEKSRAYNPKAPTSFFEINFSE